MAKVRRHDPDAEATWVDHDNFIDQDGQWWRVVEALESGRLRAVCYFVCDGYVIEGRQLTTRFTALDRPTPRVR